MKKTAKSRGILGPPSPLAFRHLLDAAKSLQAADAAYLQAYYLNDGDEASKVESLTKRKTFEVMEG